ncbi:cGMP-dependent protein kinase 1 isoform X3 [Thalassophryne amazonica]|uniref:cGMP-dependent protein kinase 1 isoform X3 n=1 Tax=Thalassophryne amazonica TaxID=390379 RepID=UPI001470FC56|nr:cGMP-dependent protein kinase 1 isoform X3 [Thalassophryne amazonica]
MGTLRDLQFALQLKIEELRQRDTLIDELELELDTKDELIRRLQEELDRCRATVSLPGPSVITAAEGVENHRRTICEPLSPDLVTVSLLPDKSCEKSQRSQMMIQAAFMKSDLLKNLDEGEIRAVTACMVSITIHRGCCVIQEGTRGAQAYILEEGRLDVTKDGHKLLVLEPENLFGELALLYNCTHTYSVSAQTVSRLWVIDRKTYQNILMQRNFSSLSHAMELLSSVSFLQSLPRDVIMKMSDLMEEMHYGKGDYIIRQGATGDTFYIISKGQVKVTEHTPGCEEQVILSELSERHWFGEKALWGDDVRTASVIAASDVTCLVIDRETFKDVMSGLAFDESHNVQQSDESSVSSSDEDPMLLSCATLRDFLVLGTLGVGEFGHVDLVQLKSNVKCVFAMKVLKSTLIFNNGQQEHIRRERRILTDLHCPFVVRLYRTYRGAECVYMLTEACLGGNLCRLLRDKGSLDECSTRFYTACAVQALTYLHCHGIIYRDLKPENVAVDDRGYAKLMISRCVKKVELGHKTWTFCGTPGYMAPEIILNRGHSTAVDFWSLGIFVFELLSGGLPFSGHDQMNILTATIRGIDQIDVPKSISKSASSLIKKLCRNNPSERLGSQTKGAKEIQKHKWFEGFNWDGLCKSTLKPPSIPKLQSLLDNSETAYYTEHNSVMLCTNWDDF